MITEFANVTQEPQGLPPHRGIFDHAIRLTTYIQNDCVVTACPSLDLRILSDNALTFSNILVRISNSPYVAQLVMVRKADRSIRVCVDVTATSQYVPNTVHSH